VTPRRPPGPPASRVATSDAGGDLLVFDEQLSFLDYAGDFSKGVLR
jgi:hypothetical protein